MNKSKFSLDNEYSDINSEIDRDALNSFAKGALTHKINDMDTNEDWQQEDPHENPSYNFRLRLNKYQIGLLKRVSKLEKRSISSMIKIILMEQLLIKLKSRL